jgi:hypothetical protein
MEKDSAMVSVELVENAISTHSQSELAAALESIMGKGFEAGAHVIDFALDRIAHRRR